MANKNKSCDRITLVERLKAYTEQIRSIEDEIGLTIKNLQQEWDNLSIEEQVSKIGLRLQNDAGHLHDINLRLVMAGMMLDEFRTRKRDSVAEDF